MKKELDVVNVEDAKKKIDDLVVVGNVDMFQLLCKASSKRGGWMKSAKAMEIPGVGCLVQVTTRQGENVAEALTFIPNVRIEPDINNGKKLVSDYSFLHGVNSGIACCTCDTQGTDF